MAIWFVGTAVSASERFWWLAPTLSAIAAILIIWFNWGRDQLRAWRMRRGIEVHLTVAPEGGSTNWGYELHVPPEAELSIQLRLKPRFDYQQHTVIFGFRGKPDEKPEPISYLNTFIRRGLRREQSPDTHDNQFVDYNGSYHLRDERPLVNTTHYSYGFVVRTKKPGRYPIVFIAITDCGEAVPTNELFLTVEERSTKSLKGPQRFPDQQGRLTRGGRPRH